MPWLHKKSERLVIPLAHRLPLYTPSTQPAARTTNVHDHQWPLQTTHTQVQLDINITV